LFSYSAAWLAVSVIVVYIARRRVLLNLVTGAAVLVPLALARLAGFEWLSGLARAHAYLSGRVAARSWLAWVCLDLMVVAVVCGPAVMASARKLRRTPAWPFVIGAVLAIGYAVLLGFSRGAVERSFLPYYPWLLLPAVAPERRPVGVGVPATGPTPVLLLTAAGVTAIVLEAVLRSPW
jgi:hypothetical protein